MSSSSSDGLPRTPSYNDLTALFAPNPNSCRFIETMEPIAEEDEEEEGATHPTCNPSDSSADLTIPREESEWINPAHFADFILSLADTAGKHTRFFLLLAGIETQIRFEYPRSMTWFQQRAQAFARAQDQRRPGDVGHIHVYYAIMNTAKDIFFEILEDGRLDTISFCWGILGLSTGFANVGSTFPSCSNPFIL
jgi:hypothetical protein